MDNRKIRNGAKNREPSKSGKDIKEKEGRIWKEILREEIEQIREERG